MNGEPALSGSEMREYPKSSKHLLRRFAIEAYERELHLELTKLDQSFTEWRNGSISNAELSHRIHLYETTPSRELYNRYNTGDDAMNVAFAIVAGLLRRDEIPADVLDAIESHIAFYLSLKDRGELHMPGE
jgi:hypothetical protein